MDIKIVESAYKHGFTDESIYSCLFNSGADEMAGPTSSLKPQQTESWQRRLMDDRSETAPVLARAWSSE
jgi:hypothetical protein